MQITVKTEVLAKALNRVGIATHCPTLPILSSVLIEAANDTLKLSATDLDIYVTETIESEVKGKGSIAVAFSLLSRFIARATAQETTMKMDEHHLLVVTHGENVAYLETLPADDFPPQFEIPKDAKTWTGDVSELLKPIAMLQHAMSKEESRYSLCGINLSSQNGVCDLVATDGKRMAIYKSSIGLKGVSAIIPDIAVRAIENVFESGEITLSLSDTIIGIASPTAEIRSKLIEAKYPNYQEVIPETSEQFFSAQRTDLIDALTTASLFLKQKEIAVRIEGRGKEIEIGCYDRFKTRIMGTELAGQPKALKRVNYQFPLDCLRVLENDTVRIEVSEGAPMVIREGAFTEVINGLT